MNPLDTLPVSRREAITATTAAVLGSLAADHASAAEKATRVLVVVGPSNHPPGTHEVAAGGPMQTTTTITYGDRNALVAQALQRTLPGPANLVRCRDDCQGIRLALGADAAKWSWAGRGDQALKGD